MLTFWLMTPLSAALPPLRMRLPVPTMVVPAAALPPMVSVELFVSVAPGLTVRLPTDVGAVMMGGVPIRGIVIKSPLPGAPALPAYDVGLVARAPPV